MDQRPGSELSFHPNPTRLGQLRYGFPVDIASDSRSARQLVDLCERRQLDGGACLIGRRTLNRVSPGTDENSISPPCRSATMRLLITKPRPVPDPTPLVV